MLTRFRCLFLGLGLLLAAGLGAPIHAQTTFTVTTTDNNTVHGNFIGADAPGPPAAGKHTASDGAAGSFFGIAVALDGPRALVGAVVADAGAADAGAVYVFEREGDQWQETARLVPDAVQQQAFFGNRVALDGDRALVGARSTGFAYVFDRIAGQWQQTARLEPSVAGEGLGQWVALDGDRAAGSSNNAGEGAVYLFERQPGGAWMEVARLVSPDPQDGDFFGFNVSLDGDRLLAGARFHDDAADDQGAAYVFDLIDGAWQHTATLAPDGADVLDTFGTGVFLLGDRLLVGAPGDDDQADNAGAVYVFDFIDGQWQRTAKLTAADGQAGDAMGTSVAFRGDRLLASAHFEDDNGDNAGAVYVFDFIDGQWQQTDKLTASDGQDFDNFGIAVDFNGGWGLFGAPFDDDQGEDAGAVYVFDLNRAPSAASITSPVDGATVLLAGDQTTPLVFAWTEAGDPDGDAVDYTWQLAADASFTNVIFFDDIPASEGSTLFVTDVGAMTQLLRDRGITAFPVVLFHRVLTSDGQATAEGPVA